MMTKIEQLALAEALSSAYALSTAVQQLHSLLTGGLEQGIVPDLDLTKEIKCNGQVITLQVCLDRLLRSFHESHKEASESSKSLLKWLEAIKEAQLK